MDSIRTLASSAGPNLAVVWASRADADAPEAAAAAPEGDAAAAGDAASAAGDADPAAPAPDAKDAYYMNPPEINSAILSGLLVALIFLLIFVSGFMCLTRITAPETFEIMDSNDMKKKMQ